MTTTIHYAPASELTRLLHQSHLDGHELVSIQPVRSVLHETPGYVPVSKVTEWQVVTRTENRRKALLESMQVVEWGLLIAGTLILLGKLVF